MATWPSRASICKRWSRIISSIFLASSRTTKTKATLIRQQTARQTVRPFKNRWINSCWISYKSVSQVQIRPGNRARPTSQLTRQTEYSTLMDSRRTPPQFRQEERRIRRKCGTSQLLTWLVAFRCRTMLGGCPMPGLRTRWRFREVPWSWGSQSLPVLVKLWIWRRRRSCIPERKTLSSPRPLGQASLCLTPHWSCLTIIAASHSYSNLETNAPEKT